MKNSFSCFYDLVDDDELKTIWKDPQTIFIFDTNVLLSLYSFQPESRKDFFKVLFPISDRIWIPFHVGLEFQKNRLNVIKSRRNTFSKLNSEIDKLIETIKFDTEPFSRLQTDFSLQKNYLSVHEKLNINFIKIKESFDELQKSFQSSIMEIKDEVVALDKDKVFVNSRDFIREEIDKIFSVEKIGTNTFDTKEKLEALYKEGNNRYKNKIPPGYEDEKKGEDELFFDGLGYKRKFGDLIIFKQMIDFSKRNSIKNIVFISEDIKTDWRHIEKQGGNKILGARPELKRELYKEAGVENFLIYQIEEFMKKTNEYLNIKIKEDTLKNIKLSLEEDKHLQLQKIEKLKKQDSLEKIRSKLAEKYFGESLEVPEDLQDEPVEEYIREQEEIEEYIREQEEEIEEYIREQEELEEYIREQEELAEEAERYFREEEEIEKRFLKEQAELEEQAERYFRE